MSLTAPRRGGPVIPVSITVCAVQQSNSMGRAGRASEKSGSPVKTFLGKAIPSLVTIFGPAGSLPLPKPTLAPTSPPTLEPLGDEVTWDGAPNS
ncbi:hypothetical protein WJX74_010767 [Apatococcus lobatus]|uniref:Uncharacterized protein n=1 Tax=Apatococcus lobatus TaxID=904363 RepID=A0AAW1PZI0_9CHLO